MGEVSANELTKTYYCKQPGCENEASSPVGRYAYCKEHQGGARTGSPKTAPVNTTEAALRDLIGLARQVDKAKAKADALRRQANQADKAADALENEYAAALSQAARGAAV